MVLFTMFNIADLSVQIRLVHVSLSEIFNNNNNNPWMVQIKQGLNSSVVAVNFLPTSASPP
jgi:hypothetical protein